MTLNANSSNQQLALARRFGLGLMVAAAALSADQLSKWFMIAAVMDPPRTIPITPFFNFVLGFNRGVSFGLLSDLGPAGPTVITVLSITIVVFLLAWLWRSTAVWDIVGIGMVIGGALGNLIDRVRVGAVTDFLDFYVGQYHWPAFNLADTGIAMGVGLILIGSLRSSGEPR